ncbi:hypothetical protein VaNZ11_002120 [Volvox africanus]|uniref:Peptidase S8/S53 domain-containing protein n=1 Tax=Volvox africanus TaxID=51714 RepID=A0ABQ5RR96_9CHLO|nr:hypothetical protein VaNZ11_002120 [Volvox africanus]
MLGSRLCLLAYMLLLFNRQIRTVVATKRVTLRTGHVDLRQLVPVASFSQLARDNVAAQNGASGVRDVSGSGDAATRRLFLVSYSDSSHAAELRDALVAGGASMLSYIPENTLLVAASLSAVSRISSQLNASAAALSSKHKISPDWEPIFTAAAAAAVVAATSNSSGSSRSSGSASAGGTSQSADVSGSSAIQEKQQQMQWLQSSLAKLQASELLSQLRTIRRLAPSKSSGSEAAAAATEAVVLYGVVAEILPGLTSDQRRAIASEWAAALALGRRQGSDGGGGGGQPSDSDLDLCGPEVDSELVTAGVSDMVSLYLCEQDIIFGVNWLADRDVVKWVAPLTAPRTADVVADILLQSGKLDMDQYFDVTSFDPGVNWPYWTAGLQGQGEVIGLADTGLDLNHCAFSDVRYSGVYEAALANNATSTVFGVASYVQIPGHRKVAQYAKLGVAGDSADNHGHGTLVAGSLAGAMLSDPEDPDHSLVIQVDATGAAPRARLSVVDAQGGDGGSGVMLWVPYDAYGLYLPLHLKAGASISSDSWGSAFGTGYESQSQSFDKFLWENPNFISLLSAGNEGTKSLARYTVSSPAVAKNVVAVGAGYSLPSGFGSRSQYAVRGVQRDGTKLYRPIFPMESYLLTSLATIASNRNSGTIPIVIARPIDACSALQNPLSILNGALIMAVTGYCSVAEQAVHVEQSGGAALMVIADSVESFTAPYPVDDNNQVAVKKIAVSMIQRDIGLTLVMFVYEGGQLNFTRSVIPVDSRTITEYSAWGPTPDGRLKPDIIAPGVAITSTDTTARYPWDTCITRQYDGTSASTPLAAGHVAIMRQYLRSGFYPTGAPTDPESAPFTPTGILLKALVIAGAESLEGGWAFNGGVKMGPAPDGYQGWGRMNLAGSLPLSGYTDPRVRLQLVDRGEFMTPGQYIALGGLIATGTGPVTIVLAYYDYPADPNALTTLVNDLDLEVFVNDVVYLGNNPESAEYPNPDGANTVERVRLSSLPAGSELEIRVSAVFLPSLGLDPDTPQRWAVAVVGHFEGLLRSELNPAWLRLGSIPPSPPPPSPPAPPRAKAPRAPLKKKSPPPPLPRPRKPPPRAKPPPRMKLPPRSPN